MNAALATTEALPAATPIGVTYSVWSLSKGSRWDCARPRQDLAAATLAEAVALATPGPTAAYLAKGGFGSFVILETDERASEGSPRHMLHFYTVKAKREWRRLGQFGEPIQAAIPYAVHAGSLAMEAFEARRQFSIHDGDCSVTGRQPGEGRLIDVAANRGEGR